MRDLNAKPTFENLTRRDLEKYSKSGGMTKKLVAGWGVSKAYFGPSKQTTIRGATQLVSARDRRGAVEC